MSGAGGGGSSILTENMEKFPALVATHKLLSECFPVSENIVTGFSPSCSHAEPNFTLATADSVFASSLPPPILPAPLLVVEGNILGADEEDPEDEFRKWLLARLPIAGESPTRGPRPGVVAAPPAAGALLGVIPSRLAAVDPTALEVASPSER